MQGAFEGVTPLVLVRRLGRRPVSGYCCGVGYSPGPGNSVVGNGVPDWQAGADPRRPIRCSDRAEPDRCRDNIHRSHPFGYISAGGTTATIPLGLFIPLEGMQDKRRVYIMTRRGKDSKEPKNRKVGAGILLVAIMALLMAACSKATDQTVTLVLPSPGAPDADRPAGPGQ